MHLRTTIIILALAAPGVTAAEPAAEAPSQNLAASPSVASAAAISATPAQASATEVGIALQHYLSYDSSEHRSAGESGAGDEVVGYGTGLDLSNTEVTNADLKQLTGAAFEKVKSLNLRGTKVTDAGLVHLKPLRNLKTLILEGTRINGSGFVHLRELPIATLNLEDTKLSNDGLKTMAGMKVESLNLTLTRITDQGLLHLEKLPNLRSLNLYSTDITDEGLLYIYELSLGKQLNLQKLFLTGTQVTEPEVERLRFKFPDLVVIY